MKKKVILFLFFGLLLIIIIISLIISLKKDSSSHINNTQMVNPSAVYCMESGYKYEIRDKETGQYGVCIFPDDSECNAWDYFCACKNDAKYCTQKYKECRYKCK